MQDLQSGISAACLETNPAIIPVVDATIDGRYMLEVVGGKQSEPRLIQSGGIVVYPDSYESVYSLMRGVNPRLLETVFTDIRGGVACGSASMIDPTSRRRRRSPGLPVSIAIHKC